MTPDLASQLIADCRALIATMYPVIDALAIELAGGGGHQALNARLRSGPLEEAGNEDRGVLGRPSSPAL
jgi:hypothetical protein